jgi:citrate lyase subunit beta/citryl-CoA lyase
MDPITALMINPLEPRHLAKLPTLTAGVALLNLEDGIAPERKEAALEAVCEAIAHQKSPALKVVRVNPLDAGGSEEIAVLNRVKPDAIRIAKIHSHQEVLRAEGLIDPAIKIHLSIETKEGFEALSTLKTSSRVESVYLGILDLLESLGLPQSLLKRGNPTIDYLLARFLIKARTAGFHPFGLTYQDFRDEAGFEAWCHHLKEMGYEAMSCISPKQVSIAQRIFAPDEAAIVRAKAIKSRFEQMAAQGITGFSDETYGFIDEPIYKDALLTLSKTPGDHE